MKNGKPNILVVEDDKPVRSLISNTLEFNGYQYIAAENSKEALMLASSHNPDIILLDLGLPDMDGTEVIQKVRTWSQMPIIVISARSEDRDKIQALDAGADDYLTKPFSVEELLARLRSTTRRLNYLMSGESQGEAVYRNGDLEIQYDAAVVKVRGEEVHLMPIEYSLLVLLAKNSGKVLTYRYILEQVWVHSMESDLSSLRVYMASLRKKIEKGCEKGTYIQTHIGIGYRMIRVESKEERG